MSLVPAPIPGMSTPARRASLARMAVSPAAGVATAVGAGIGVLDRSALVAIVLGAVGWAGRMTVGVVTRRYRAAQAAKVIRVDPWSVPEPWRQLLRQAVGSQERFQQAVGSWPPGPSRDRLAGLRPRLQTEIESLSALARQGAAAGGWSGPGSSGRPSAASLSEELRRVQAERARLAGTGAAQAQALERTEAAVAEQLRALRRAEEVEGELHDRLRVAVARLDQSVTELLSMTGVDVETALGQAGLPSALDDLRDGISSLHSALTETATPPERGTP